MKLMAALALAGGLIAAPLIATPMASATPGSCDGAGCVPFVSQNVAAGQHCTQGTRYIFGLDATGNTLVCGLKSQWAPSAPLVGVRTLRLPCDPNVDKGVAQTPDGVPLTCTGGAWSADYSRVFY
jgi:hypothetical protein